MSTYKNNKTPWFSSIIHIISFRPLLQRKRWFVESALHMDGVRIYNTLCNLNMPTKFVNWVKIEGGHFSLYGILLEIKGYRLLFKNRLKRIYLTIWSFYLSPPLIVHPLHNKLHYSGDRSVFIIIYISLYVMVLKTKIISSKRSGWYRSPRK